MPLTDAGQTRLTNGAEITDADSGNTYKHIGDNVWWQVSICCPVCRMASWNPNDITFGYCGHCHEFTTPTQREDRHG